jgi:NADPH2:quinone reductase
MRVVVVRRHGGPEELRVEDAPPPAAGPGDVIVRVVRAGVNFTDTERRSGRHRDTRLPFVPGIEAAGVVERVGEGVDVALAGRRVAALAQDAYAELVRVPAADLMLVPDAVSWDQAASFPVQGLTAYHALHAAARLRAGETVLVHAAAGGVGQWCVQLARRAGARVFGTCSSAAKADTVRALGADDAFDYRAAADGVLARTNGRGVDVVLDSVGRDTEAVSRAALAPFGRLVHLGTASGPPAPIDVEDLYERSIQVGAFWLRTPLPPDVMRAAADDLLDGLARGTLRAPAATVHPLEDAAGAHVALESRRTQGKLLLAME